MKYATIFLFLLVSSHIVHAQSLSVDNQSPEACQEARLLAGENHNVLFGGVALPGQMQSSGNTFSIIKLALVKYCYSNFHNMKMKMCSSYHVTFRHYPC